MKKNISDFIHCSNHLTVLRINDKNRVKVEMEVS